MLKLQLECVIDLTWSPSVGVGLQLVLRHRLGHRLGHRLRRAVPLRATSLPVDREGPLRTPAQASGALDRTHHRVKAALHLVRKQ